MTIDNDLNEAVCLKRFLSWLLDARWFPETDDSVKRTNRAQLRRLRTILKRMEIFAREFPDERLARGLAEWRGQEQTLAANCRSTIRRSPIMQITSQNKAEMTTASHLLCASLIIPKLWPDEGVYQKMVYFLKHPSKLPNETAQAGCEIPRRQFHRTEKALQTMVQRLRYAMKSGESAFGNDFEVLGSVYGHYCWLSLGRAGYCDSEKEMLASLVGNGTTRTVAREIQV